MKSSIYKRKVQIFKPEDIDTFISKALRWASHFSHCAYYCPNKHQYLHGAFEHFLAAGAISVLEPFPGKSFESLKLFHEASQDWIVGNLTYDLKNEVEALNSNNADHIRFRHIN